MSKTKTINSIFITEHKAKEAYSIYKIMVCFLYKNNKHVSLTNQACCSIAVCIS